MKVRFEKWPWQIRPHFWAYQVGTTNKKWGWSHPGGMGRFGGGRRWKLGILRGENTVIFELIFGSIRIDWEK